MIDDIKNIWKYREMLYELTCRELRGKYKGSILGFLWTYINPLAQMAIYYFVFSQIFRNGIEQFHIYLIVSMFPWNMFTGGVLQGLGSIRYQGDLVKKVYFPRQILPMVSMTVNCINMLISFVIIYSILLISGWGINLRIQGWLLLVVLIEYLFSLGLALLLSAVEVYFRDIEHIVTVLMMVWMYVTPMFYSLDDIPEKFLIAFRLNPMLYIVGSYQQILYYKLAPKSEYIFKAIVCASVSLFIGGIMFSVLEKRFAEEL